MNISSQKTEENQTTVMKNINFNSDIITISEENRNKNKISKKLLIIIGIALGLIILSVIILVVVLINKKKEKHYTIKNYLNSHSINYDFLQSPSNLLIFQQCRNLLKFFLFYRFLMSHLFH